MFDFEDTTQNCSEDNSYFEADAPELTMYEQAEIYNNYIELFWNKEHFKDIFKTCFYFNDDDPYFINLRKVGSTIEVEFSKLNHKNIKKILSTKDKNYNEYAQLLLNSENHMTISNELELENLVVPNKVQEYRRFAGTDIPYIYKMLKWYAIEFLKRPNMFDEITDIKFCNITKLCLNVFNYNKTCQMPYDFLYPEITERDTVETHPNLLFESLYLSEDSLFLPIIKTYNNISSYRSEKTQIYNAPGNIFGFINNIIKRETSSYDCMACNSTDKVSAEPLDFAIRIYCNTLKFKSFESVVDSHQYVPNHYKVLSNLLCNYSLSFPLCTTIFATADTLAALALRTTTAHDVDVFPLIANLFCRLDTNFIICSPNEYAKIFSKLSRVKHLHLEISNYSIEKINYVSFQNWDCTNRTTIKKYKPQSTYIDNTIVNAILNNLSYFKDTGLSLNFIHAHLYKLLYKMPNDLQGIKYIDIDCSISVNGMITEKQSFETYNEFIDFIRKTQFLVSVQENSNTEEKEELFTRISDLEHLIAEQRNALDAYTRNLRELQENLDTHILAMLQGHMNKYMTVGDISYERL